MSDDIETLVARLPQLGDAVLVTLQLTVGGALLAMVVALLLGFGSRTRTLWVRGPSRVVVEFFRGTSLVVQFFWLFYVLPAFGFKLESMAVGILALGLNYGAYGAEVVRGSINSVPRGQWEACTALNLGPVHRIRRVIFPQAWALMLPMLANLLIQLLKGSALATYVYLHDVFFWTDQLRTATRDTFFSFTVGLVVYFVIAYVLTWGMNGLEARAKRRLGVVPTRPTLRDVLRVRPADPASPGTAPSGRPATGDDVATAGSQDDEAGARVATGARRGEDS
ncbi:ectoine/hydroxyectoine ABC transporter permease subunit EhuC [Cellulosimicrobium protaetiae]|uniref:Ectoine/hydroxyectoine ABC transporter permease subunit EhuC n=1 Tax=Cellulosimicrobium protaetiae TaxID=2587808 RepID=A0A6M5UCX6_9MICO|nr:ectoine/hydroxyectoine ABC transporter permease subunit EhuC [Cellulosimicrobium protaetiae]QJW35904.1 ectoine/hydroxyectoine ABC transporter permease subunit EhuC [Cellulosimicrobium protaetiae]